MPLLDEEEYERWMKMAKHTLLSAENDLEGGFYAWACFKSHQAAEYAVKALLWGTGSPAYGHSLIKLAGGLPGLKDLWEDLAVLDKYYTRREAEDAVRRAGRVVERVEEVWRSLRGGGRSLEKG